MTNVNVNLQQLDVGAIFRAGHLVAQSYFGTCDDSALAMYIEDARSSEERVSNAGMSALAGFAWGLSELLEASKVCVEKAGMRLRFDPEPPSFSTVSYRVARDGYMLAADSDLLPLLMAAIKGCKKAMPSATVGSSPAKDQLKDEKPQKIEIVSMPNRETVTTVERDSQQEILRTVQTERDA